MSYTKTVWTDTAASPDINATNLNKIEQGIYDITNVGIVTNTAAVFASTNPLLYGGQKGRETDTGREKTGDGATYWNSLAYDNDHIFSSGSTTKIYVKYLTGTTAASLNTAASVTHGLTAANIVCVSASVTDGAGNYFPPGFTFYSGNEYQVNWGSSAIYVINVNSNSANILSKTFKLAVMYTA